MKETILDTIKNVNYSSNLEELKEIRHHIIIIRQYIHNFEDDLKSIYVNKL
jgi:hypothetical protein